MPAIKDNGDGRALVSWAAVKSIIAVIAVLVTVTIGSLAWAARSGAQGRQVQINTADIAADKEADAAFAKELTKLQVGQAEIKVMIRELQERRN